MNVVETRLPGLLGVRPPDAGSRSEHSGRPRLFGFRRRGEPTIRLEHADPAADGAVFDPVDDACRRAPVARRSDADPPAR